MNAGTPCVHCATGHPAPVPTDVGLPPGGELRLSAPDAWRRYRLTPCHPNEFQRREIPMCDVCGDAQHEPRVSRRDFLKTGALAALVPWSIGAAIAADPPAPGAAPAANAIAPAEALKRLMEGNARYAANMPNER